ncbi:acyltransferase [Akkermansiaceae bacterium]|nr:acyltransferase [Akkermansiaceae bacterium]
MESSKYRADIDGLRAVAVLLVLLYHAGLPIPGGYVGVDVFFVISGYLITGVIWGGLEKGSFSLKRFWERRMRRILPAATVVVMTTMVAGVFLLIPCDLMNLARSSIAQQLMMSNMYFWQNTGYFDGSAELKPLLHTWSLAVEEQFYLGYPIALIVLHKIPKLVCKCILWGAFCVSLFLSVWAVHNAPSAAYYLLPTRMFELILGGLLVFQKVPQSRNVWMPEMLVSTGFVGILLSGFSYSTVTRFPGLAALVPCVGAVMIIYGGSWKTTSLTKVLSLRPIVYLGLISYSLYLWHWPLLAFLRYWLGNDLDATAICVVLVASILLAHFTWKHIEVPFRKGLPNWRLKHLALTTACTMLFVVGASAYIVSMHGLPKRLPKSIRNYLEFDAEYRTFRSSVDQLTKGEVTILGVSNKGRVDLLLWGDSHAGAVAGHFARVSKDLNLACGVVSVAGKPPLLGVVNRDSEADAERINRAILHWVDDNQVSKVCLVGSWRSYIDVAKALIYEEGGIYGNKANSERAFESGLRKTLTAFEQRGVSVWIMKQVPHQDANPTVSAVRSLYFGGNIPSGIGLSRHRVKQNNANRIIDRVASDFNMVTVIDPADYCFDQKGFSLIGDRQGLYYRDCGHLSSHGAEKLLGTPITKMLRAVMEE